MKVGYPPFSAASKSHSTFRCSGSTRPPSRSVIVIDPGRISTTRSSSRTTISRVCSRKAGMSEARKFSPSPRPTTSGLCRRAPTITSGSATRITTRARAPSASLITRRTASARSRSAISSIMCATTSVSVSEAKVWPRASKPDFSAAQFSMMPLWTTITDDEQSPWG